MPNDLNIRVIHTKNLKWVDIINPGEKELRWLRDNFQFHPLHYQAVAEHQQRPHIDQGENYDFMVLLFPVYNKQTQEIQPGEVDFFVSNKLLVTAHYGEIYTLKQLFENIQTADKTRDELMYKGAGFLLYKILEELFRRSYPILDHISKDVGDLEMKIFHRADTDLLSKISIMKKNIIEYRKMMKTHRYVLEKLPKRRVPYLAFPQSKLYYRDLLEYSGNIWDILEALKETVESLSETSQSLATHRLNNLTKVISLFSAIVIPATLVAFLFGVGVEGIPFRHHPYGFWIVLLLMISASLILLLIFKFKKWF